MHTIRRLTFLSLFSLISICSSALSIEINNWSFRKAGDSSRYPAVVPGGIYKDLKRNGIIPDPYSGINEQKLAWIDSADWEYKSVFDVKAVLLKSKNIRLDFSALDTYAEVLLNDSVILKADNMFRKWSVNVKSILREKNNELVVRFRSDLKIAAQLEKEYGRSLPGDQRVFLRKAAYKFGWDFGPRFISGGICGKVTLNYLNELEVGAFQSIAQLKSDSNALVNLKMELYSPIRDSVVVTMKCKQTGDSTSLKMVVNEGKNMVSSSLLLLHPRLWWPNGCGNQNRYSISVQLVSSKGLKTDTSFRTGIRSISLIRTKDDIGSSFLFNVNGLAVYMRGANIVPPDHFTDASDDSLWINLVLHAKNMNMNIIRVWGGGIYPPEAFFEACDKYGILVWQDFMFACGMYPGSDDFLNNVAAEARQQVERISSHPCLAVWCGNNENEEGWNNWGWQKQYVISSSDSIRMWTDYEKLFSRLLPEIVKDCSPDLNYISSSPKNGWGRKESLTEGDCHYWGVWWGKEPFSNYAAKVPRFMSEFGFQAFPDRKSMETFSGEKLMDLSSPLIKSHQKHSAGYETIEEYRKGLFSSYSDIDEYIYQSQLTQWVGLSTAVVAERNSNRRCMGSLIWQLNDTWPAVSWSLIDYYGKKKAAAYKLADEFQSVKVYLSMEGNELICQIVSDSSVELENLLSIQQFEMDGELIKKWARNVKIPANGNIKIQSTAVNAADCFFVVDLGVMSSSSYLVKTADQSSHKPEVLFDLITFKGKKALQIKCNEIAKNVQFSLDGNTDILEQNYLDLYPRNPRYIILKDQSITEEQVKMIRVIAN